MEIEKKFKASIEFDQARKILESLGFVKTKESHQIDSYYIVNQKINSKDIYLRVRQDIKNSKYSFDFHEIISDLATKETEISLNETDFEKIKYIMTGLQFNIVSIIDKFRLGFKNDECAVVLDCVKKLGNFIEIEVEGEENPETIAIIEKYQNLLQLRDSDLVSGCGYPDLMIQAQNQSGAK